MMVDLPEPDGPTSAVTVPGSERKLTSYSTCLPRLVGEADVSKTRLRREWFPARHVRFGSSSSGRSRSTSRVRSSPANASVNCVPMLTTWITGAIRNARNAMNVIEVAQRHACAGEHLAARPRTSTTAPTMPISTVAERLINDIAVSDFSTLSSSRCTPPANTSASRSSA